MANNAHNVLASCQSHNLHNFIRSFLYPSLALTTLLFFVVHTATFEKWHSLVDQVHVVCSNDEQWYCVDVRLTRVFYHCSANDDACAMTCVHVGDHLQVPWSSLKAHNIDAALRAHDGAAFDGRKLRAHMQSGVYEHVFFFDALPHHTLKMYMTCYALTIALWIAVSLGMVCDAW